jgi:hypothetical protein
MSLHGRRGRGLYTWGWNAATLARFAAFPSRFAAFPVFTLYRRSLVCKVTLSHNAENRALGPLARKKKRENPELQERNVVGELGIRVVERRRDGARGESEYSK